MKLRTGGYSGQILFTFNKLAELFFEKKKSYNMSLIAEIRALISTVEYDEKSEIDTTTGIFQMSILFKRSRFFISDHTDQQLLEEVQISTRKKDLRKYSFSLV